jgi:two-component system phosphate regulon response regulator PhoB
MAKILIVEDTKDVAKALAMRMRSKGHTALVAHNASEGTAMAISEHPDLVLLDIAMPPSEKWGVVRAGGLAMASRLRQDDQTTAIPVIFLTASRDDKVRAKAMDFAPAAFLEKPYNPDTLFNEVNSALAAASQNRPAA